MPDPGSPSQRDDGLRALLPMCYVGNALFAIVILIHNSVQPSGYLIGGALVLLLLAGGNFLRFRWSMAASIALALIIFSLAIIGWAVYGLRPLLIALFFPPLIIAFNIAALYCTATGRPPNSSR